MMERRPISEVFSYCPDSGHVTWLIEPRAGIIKVGDLAGYITKDGYRAIRYRRKWYPAHHVAWFLMTGVWPKMIDHKNLNKGDNRWENLREATPLQNNANVAGRGKYPKGVTFHKQVGRYQAAIKVEGRSHYLGLHDTPEQAHAAYIAAATRFFGEFARAA